jgi:hypothetical protein
MVWTLYEDGNLQQREVQGSLEKNYTTSWRVADRSQVRISVSPTSQYVVLGTQEPSGVQVFDCSTEQNRTIELGKDALLRDFQWLDFGAAEPPRLAVITHDGQTLLIDPTNREQLSGRCPVEPFALLPAYGKDATGAAYVVLADGSVEPLQPASTLGDHSFGGSVHPAAHATPLAASLDGRVGQTPAKLGFQPDQGPWVTWRDGDLPLTLASGWLAKDEPAVFMLDQQLQRLWHYRMPLQVNKAWSLVAVANDPASGQVVWAVSSSAHTLHVLRADGMVTDHFSVQEALVGIALVPSGSRLILIVVHPQETIRYALRWN